MLTLEYDISVNPTDGESANFIDSSIDYGIGGNITYSDVKDIRFYRGNYVDDQNVQLLSGSGTMEQWREYQSQTLAPFTYDNKIIPIAGKFIPFISGIIVQSNSIMQTTGRYSPYISPATYLPLVTKNVLVLTPADFGLTDTIFPDRVYYGQYEVYIDTSPTTLTNVTNGNMYIVYGGATGTCTYNGSIYRPGEVFIAGDNNAVVFANGAVLKILGALRFKYFTFTYNIQKSLADLTVRAIADCKATDDLMYKIVVMRAKLKGLQTLNIMNWTSAALAQNTIDDITKEIAVITNWYNSL